ncbi:bacterial extracellular solute-binding protein [Streptococcus pneumoniae]|nr:bacterial extracellular solute-binding protein [Streptococcus pneumoniae]
MRDLYDKFAEEHKDSSVEFKPTPVNGDLKDIMNNKVASGEFPDGTTRTYLQKRVLRHLISGILGMISLRQWQALENKMECMHLVLENHLFACLIQY